MTHDQFWQIIADACRSDPYSAEEWHSSLSEALANLPANEIIEWDKIFDTLANRAYCTDLWAAAYLINGGASDDGFYYFRCWLIGMGKEVYCNAIVHPDSLADVVSPSWFAEGLDAEAEIYGAAYSAWKHVTGKSCESDYPVRTEFSTLVGDDWDFGNSSEMRRRLPRLAALYEE